MKTASLNRTNGEYNVCLLGASLDAGNQGCSALAVSLVKLLIDSEPNCRINLLYSSRKGGVRSLRLAGRTVKVNVVNCQLSPRSRINEHLFWIFLLALIQRIILIRPVRNTIVRSNRWLRTLHKADFVGEIRSGDSFSDIYGLRKFLLGIIPSIIAILMRKELVLLPQTYGPFNSKIAKSVARYILLRAHRIFARDTESIELVRELLRRKSKDKTIEFCPDVAFTLEAALPEEPDIQPKLHRNNSTSLIGLNISGLLYVGGFTRDNMFGLKFDYKEFAHKMISWLMEWTNADVLLVPHVYWGGVEVERDELQICRELRESMDAKYAERLHLIMQEYDQSQIKGIIGLCDFFIGSRMHACIAALSQCIPTVGLAYSRKFRGVFQSIGLEQFVIDMRQKKSDEILKIILDAFNHRDSTIGNLKTTVPEVKQRIQGTFEGIL